MIISVIVIHLKNIPAALPLLALAVADKAEVAPIAALAEGLGADEVGVGQRAVVDDVGMAEHRTETFEDATPDDEEPEQPV